MKQIIEWIEDNVVSTVLGIVIIIFLGGFILGAIIF